MEVVSEDQIFWIRRALGMDVGWSWETNYLISYPDNPNFGSLKDLEGKGHMWSRKCSLGSNATIFYVTDSGKELVGYTKGKL